MKMRMANPGSEPLGVPSNVHKPGSPDGRSVVILDNASRAAYKVGIGK
jgi:hypothetical protein